MLAKDVTVTPADASVEFSIARFRCPHCGNPHQAAVPPAAPRIAKFFCRRCENTIEVETRPSAMDSIESEFELRLDMKNVAEHPKVFSK